MSFQKRVAGTSLQILLKLIAKLFILESNMSFDLPRGISFGVTWTTLVVIFDSFGEILRDSDVMLWGVFCAKEYIYNMHAHPLVQSTTPKCLRLWLRRTSTSLRKTLFLRSSMRGLRSRPKAIERSRIAPTGFEPVFLGWEPSVLDLARRWGHILFGAPYGAPYLLIKYLTPTYLYSILWMVVSKKQLSIYHILNNGQ